METVTIKCPKCNLGLDVDIMKPAFDFGETREGVRECPNCEGVIRISIKHTEKDNEYNKQAQPADTSIQCYSTR